jgi:hypothetical protein
MRRHKQMNLLSPDRLIKGATPSVAAYFRSFYYPATYLPPVDVESTIQAQPKLDDRVVTAAQDLMERPEVQQIFSEPLSYDPVEFGKRCTALEAQGFRILSQKPVLKPLQPLQVVPFYNVSEHSALPDWVLKTGAHRVPSDQLVLGPLNCMNEIAFFHPLESLLRLSMNSRIREMAQSLNIELVVPDEYAVPYRSPAPGDLSRRYFIISRKLDLKSQQETIDHIKNMNREGQVELARKVVKLIERIGFADAHFDNFRITKEGKLALVDTESSGLLTLKGDALRPRGHSIEKCARIGLWTFQQMAQQKGLFEVAAEAEIHYQRSEKEISVTQIVLSILCPLIPLVFLILSIIQRIRIGYMAEEVIEKDVQFGGNYMFTHPSPAAIKRYQAEKKPLQEQYYSAVEGVPFVSPC